MPFNLAALQETIANAVPERTALVFRDRRYSFSELTERTRRFAHVLLAHGIEQPIGRDALSNWQSGQDQVALYLQNGNEYLEAMIGVMKARAAPFNVNYRYVAEELRYLFNNANTQAIVYHARYAPVLAAVLPDIPKQKLLIQVPDESGEALLPGALDYETALASASAERPDVVWSPDDLYILYTGGTTGMPKGVLWRQADILASALGARRKDGSLIDSLTEFAERAQSISPRRYLPTPPFMHGTAQWIGFSAWHSGHTVVIQDFVDRFDPNNLLDVIDREAVNILSLVGDAFGKPFLEALDARPETATSLTHILNGGAGMSPHIKAALLKRLAGARVIDTIGSSEAGPLARHVSGSETDTKQAPKQVGGSAVLSEDKTEVLQPGSDALGWLAKTGIVPLGYLGDESKTAETFPVIDGVRYSVPGDRVRLLESGDLDFQGRDSSSINTGGEKVFSEEVERAIGQHPAVSDVLVSWRPSERWGQEVVAIVVLAADQSGVSDADLIAEAAKHLARYKLPKAILRVDRIGRHDNGKPDYRWAKDTAHASRAD